MTVASSRTCAVFAVAAACFLAAVTTRAQAPAARPPLAEEVFKNVQVLRGIPVNEFMGTMGIFSAALGMSCEDCHRSGDSSWEDYATESPRKQMARAMVTMMAAINKTHFGGRQVITCFSCHRGTDRPKPTPNLATLYGAPPPDDPRDVFEQTPGAPAADAVFEKYLTAVGGAARASALTSFAATGTITGYGPDSEPRPFELAAKAPNQRAALARASSGDSATVFDGRSGWIAAPHRPVAVLALGGADLDGLRLDAELAFPSRIRQVAGQWRSGAATAIDDREVQPVQGTGSGGALVTLYFDSESGLLVRQVRSVPSPVGRLPTQIDYTDYREVVGVKLPFRWTVTWLDGKDTIELKDVRPNVALDAARFARPVAPRGNPAK
jgi:photosynthetic reaction center cytochrome c subunit